MPFVTAVVPLYNKARYVERCVRSIQAQSFTDFEAVIVDDGSTDDSAAVASQIADHDPRFRIVTQPNRGVSVARNRAIAEARTGLIAFLDADDEWEPGFLEAIRELAGQFPQAGILATGYRRRYPDRPDKENSLNGTGRELIQNYFRRAINADLIYPSAAAVPVDVLKAVGGFPEGVPIGEDRDLWGRIALRYPVAYDSRILSVYHSEAMGRACDKYARAFPFPPVIRTLRAELAKGSVPESQVAGVQAYIDYGVMQYADVLLYQQRRTELASLLKQERFHLKQYRFGAMLLRGALPCLPMRVIFALKWKPILLLRYFRQARA